MKYKDETCYKMPQFKGLKSGTSALPNVPFENDISGNGTSVTLKPNTKSMQGYRSKATTSSKKHDG